MYAKAAAGGRCDEHIADALRETVEGLQASSVACEMAGDAACVA